MCLLRATLGVTAIFVCLGMSEGQAQSVGGWTFTGAVGLEGQYQRYSEPSLDVTEDGWFGGITLDGRMTSGDWQVRGEFRYDIGKMDYSGSGSLDDIDDRVLETRLLLAHVLHYGPNQWIPFGGLGYRRLEDDLGGLTTTTGARGYDRTSQYLYLPIGVEGILPFDQQWTLKPSAEFDYLIKGRQESDLSQVGNGLSDIENDQNSGFGLRAALMASTKVGSVSIDVGPYIRYWHIDQSDIAAVTQRGVTVAGGFEPENETVETGLALKVWF
jgi:hypothetical protein